MRLGETSWLDHCISTQDGHSIINDMFVDYNLSCRDHIPLVMNLDLDKLPSVEDDINDVTPRLKWDNYDAIKLREYSLMSDIFINRLQIPVSALKCRNINCDDNNHIAQIHQFYKNICKCLTDASNAVFGVNCRPGFNEHVRELHDIARKRFVAWKEANKPRDTNNPFLGK